MNTYHVYIMASASRVLYIGVTNDLPRRVWEHKQKLVPGFTAKYNVTRLVWCEEHGDIRDAIAREKQIKGWLRRKKVALIEEYNGTWKDLAWGWYDQPTNCHPERSEGPHNRNTKDVRISSESPPRISVAGDSSTKRASLPRSFAALRMTSLSNGSRA
jgi:putative endonuclease